MEHRQFQHSQRKWCNRCHCQRHTTVHRLEMTNITAGVSLLSTGTWVVLGVGPSE
jgi:hypothetical protein